MAFFCPIFPRQNRIKAKEYEDGNCDSLEIGGRGLYSSKSMTALNIAFNQDQQDDFNNRRRSIDSCSSRVMMVNSDFEPTVDDELRVRKGDMVKSVYRDRQWIFVVRENENGREEGFIPFIFCDECDWVKLKHRERKTQRLALFKKANFNRWSGRRHSEIWESKVDGEGDSEMSTQEDNSVREDRPDHTKKTAIRTKALMNVDRFLRSLEEGTNVETTSTNTAGSTDAVKYGAVSEFKKWPIGRLMVEYDFAGNREDDVDVRKGELVDVLNEEDPDWYWVKKDNGREGFVPSNYVRRIEQGLPMRVKYEPSNPSSSLAYADHSENQCNEMLVVADFEPRAVDDLRVIKGDWIYSYQAPTSLGKGWLWAYCPRTERYGFVPASIVRMPEATML